MPEHSEGGLCVSLCNGAFHRIKGRAGEEKAAVKQS